MWTLKMFSYLQLYKTQLICVDLHFVVYFFAELDPLLFPVCEWRWLFRFSTTSEGSLCETFPLNSIWLDLVIFLAVGV